MREEVAAFAEEVAELDALLGGLSVADWSRETPFKAWTVWDVMAHLHWSDRQALAAIRDRDAFAHEATRLGAAAKAGRSLVTYTADALGPLAPEDLRAAWRTSADELCALAESLDPKARIGWYGPDMGLRMFVTARQMETWAHGQDVYDLLGRERQYHDRIHAIAVLGVRTFGWTFSNRKVAVPPVTPYVHLRAPSGAAWEWNPPSATERIEGEAAEFCHVVTQGRNIADTKLDVVGEIASKWMAMAQCFAGPPSTPPAAGSRGAAKSA